MNQEQPCDNFGRTINIYKAIKNIDFAWREFTAVTMNGVWKNLCLQFVHDFFFVVVVVVL